jgi:hypothetical protein
MTGSEPQNQLSPWRMLARKNVLAGLMFMGVALAALWISRNYPIGTALRMGTGYVPRLLCWILLGLGAVVLLQGVREPDAAHEKRGTGAATADAPADGSGSPPGSGSPAGHAAASWAEAWTVWRPVLFVTASLVIFGLGIERLGLVVSILLLIGVGALAARDLRPWETLAAALVLIVLSWAVFILGLGLTIPVWPEW